MNSHVVVDASAMVACLLDGGIDGQWATRQMTGATISAPSLMAFEVANIIRRSELAGLVSGDVAAQAHADYVRRSIDLWHYEVLASRVWELRHNL
ncbi:MAG: type II toxin-antitoxin system VapC family toxin, partial [Propionibacteriaceae bacterium]|nr:type II toxin-antitoxin system VapC family toxin [Propionibacteriaceae bacterium]